MPAPASRHRTGLAIAALILGLLAVFSSILLIGAVLGVLGILLGATHISKRHGPNSMAWTGIALSVVGIGISVGIGPFYYKALMAFLEPEAGTSNVERAQTTDAAFARWIGKEVPDFTVTDLKGEKLQPATLRGRRVVLDFWATWCPPCRMEIPHFIRLAKETSQDELLIIGISSEDPKTLTAFADKKGMNYPIVSANDLPAPFNTIEAIPTTFFIDRNGRIQQVVVGYHDYEPLKEMALADDLVAGGEGTPPTQR